MQSDSVMLQFQPVLVKKKSIGGTFRSRSIDAFFAQDEAIRDQFFGELKGHQYQSINGATAGRLFLFVCLFVCLSVCMFSTFFLITKIHPRIRPHTVHTTFRFECLFIIGLGMPWLLSAIFSQPAVGAKWGGSKPHRFPATSRGVRTFSVVFLFILPRPSLEFRRRWKPPEPAAKMEVAPWWRTFWRLDGGGFPMGL